ncbi:MAG: hypothetical protein D6677_07310 [Calditrichaeota bacterium]|nr:MAG: hypothetical protein D6677_07310 [Calditrichota bacterium]
MELIIQLISGAIGGNVAGKSMPNFDLGMILNSVVGILGGGLGGQILGMLGMAMGGDSSSLDIAGLAANVAGSGIGGAVLLAVIGFIKKAVSK